MKALEKLKQLYHNYRLRNAFALALAASPIACSYDLENGEIAAPVSTRGVGIEAVVAAENPSSKISAEADYKNENFEVGADKIKESELALALSYNSDKSVISPLFQIAENEVKGVSKSISAYESADLKRIFGSDSELLIRPFAEQVRDELSDIIIDRFGLYAHGKIKTSFGTLRIPFSSDIYTGFAESKEYKAGLAFSGKMFHGFCGGVSAVGAHFEEGDHSKWRAVATANLTIGSKNALGSRAGYNGDEIYGDLYFCLFGDSEHNAEALNEYFQQLHELYLEKLPDSVKERRNYKLREALEEGGTLGLQKESNSGLIGQIAFRQHLNHETYETGFYLAGIIPLADQKKLYLGMFTGPVFDIDLREDVSSSYGVSARLKLDKLNFELAFESVDYRYVPDNDTLWLRFRYQR